MEKEKLEIKGFTLLAEDKLERALKVLGEGATPEAILAEFDKLGGGIKKGERKVAMGTFYDFVEKKPRVIENYEGIGEESYEDEVKIVRKKIVKPTSEENFKKVRKSLQRAIDQKTEDDVPEKVKKSKKEE